MNGIQNRDMKYTQIQCTFPSPEEAEKVAAKVVEMRLAPCAQVVGPIRSIYRWKGEIENSTEWLLLAKTRSELFEKLCQAIRSGHPYECPQLIALEIADGSPDYLDWLDSQLEQ